MDPLPEGSRDFAQRVFCNDGWMERKQTYCIFSSGYLFRNSITDGFNKERGWLVSFRYERNSISKRVCLILPFGKYGMKGQPARGKRKVHQGSHSFSTVLFLNIKKQIYGLTVVLEAKMTFTYSSPKQWQIVQKDTCRHIHTRRYLLISADAHSLSFVGSRK